VIRAVQVRHDSHNPSNLMPPDGRRRATKSPIDSQPLSSGYLRGSTRLSFREHVSIHKSSTSKRHLTTAVIVLVLAIIGSLGAILVRSVAAAQADSTIVDLRKSLP
jgi:hypothetical protein